MCKIIEYHSINKGVLIDEEVIAPTVLFVAKTWGKKLTREEKSMYLRWNV